MSGPEDNPRDDEPIDREEYEAWERSRYDKEMDILMQEQDAEEMNRIESGLREGNSI